MLRRGGELAIHNSQSPEGDCRLNIAAQTTPSQKHLPPSSVREAVNLLSEAKSREQFTATRDVVNREGGATVALEERTKFAYRQSLKGLDTIIELRSTRV